MGDLHTTPKILSALPQTIGGFLMNVVANNQPVPPQDWLVKVSAHNKSLPPNLHLFCGDRNLDLLADPLLKRAAGDVTTFFNPYRSVACARVH